MPVILIPSSNNKKFIPLFFMHIPKTGGSSLEKYFQLIGAKVQFFREFNHLQDLMRCSPLNHLDYDLVDSIFNLKQFVFRFSITRNPFSRLASEFRFRRGRNKNWSKDIIYYDQIEPWCIDVLSSYARNKSFFSNHIRPQVDFVGPKIQKIYKLESGLASIVEDIGNQLNPSYCRLPAYSQFKDLADQKVTDKSNLSGIMTSDEKAIRNSSVVSELVRHIYRKDFDKFGYT